MFLTVRSGRSRVRLRPAMVRIHRTRPSTAQRTTPRLEQVKQAWCLPLLARVEGLSERHFA